MHMLLTLLSLLPAVPALAKPVMRAPIRRSDPSFQTLSTASNPDWMGNFSDSTSLAALSIPGTHESLALFGGVIAQCQENNGASAQTLDGQLNAGIRAFDIRLRIETNNTFVVHHGLDFQNANFDDVLDHWDTFLSAHPTEALLLRLKQECTGQLGSCTDVPGQLAFPDIFDQYMTTRATAQRIMFAPSIDRNQAAELPTLGDVRGKVVLMVMSGAFGGRTDEYGLAQFADWNNGDSTFVQDNFDVSNIGAIATKRGQVQDFLNEVNTGNQSALFVSFTSGASILAFPDAVAGGFLGEQGVNPFLLNLLATSTNTTRTSVMMMDFPGGQLIDTILGFNKGVPAAAAT